MCLYLIITCPGTCGTNLFCNTYAPHTACKLSTTFPRPDNFPEIHQIENEMLPLLPEDVPQSFPQGYTCSEPSCSYHPDATFTEDTVNRLFRCPGCGTAHSRALPRAGDDGYLWVETWVGRGGVSVPFLHQSKWAEFACTQRNRCHFNPEYKGGMGAKIQAMEAEMRESFSGAFARPELEVQVEASVLDDALLLDDVLVLDDAFVMDDALVLDDAPVLRDTPALDNAAEAVDGAPVAKKPQPQKKPQRRRRQEPLHYRLILPRPSPEEDAGEGSSEAE
ncbi:hypothetical protein VPNG_09677 [Cytospora leucostoma]|uniref:Uncharacterized protein n=1 Tax=Cytospora leucostoma TaxID=1230097 RepID=A0A423VMK1_9PEZI|nr:hypothetical protein VPNG_09677 [Cytospora leucostoma]